MSSAQIDAIRATLLGQSLQPVSRCNAVMARTVHVRKATRPETQHQKINQILGHSPNLGGTHRVLV